MSMMWIKEQSKWFVIGAALLIGAGLIMMDLPGANGRSVSNQSVGEVDGEEIPTMAFQQDLQNYIRSEEANTGKPPEGARLAQIRRDLFKYRVQSVLMGRMAKAYGLHASQEEMLDYVMRNPREVGYSIAQYEGPDAVPGFLRDSALNMQVYQGWLSQDSVYDRPGLRMIEQQLSASVIPQLQLQQVFRSQVHRTDLEEAFAFDTRENRARLQYYRVPAEAFPVDAGKITEDELKAHFESLPDSFYARTEAARLSYVVLPLVPSSADTALMRDFAQELHARAVAGESFADLARSYSSDASSAENGGELAPTARSEWVPEFADAAFSLAPGALSQPVLTPYGYHLILARAPVNEGGVQKAAVSHILLKITPGTQTIDSLTAIAEKVKAEAEESGLESAAKARGLQVSKTAVFEKGTFLPLGNTYVQGLTSFAFGGAERKSKVSEALQNEDAIFVFARDAMYPKGRDFDRAREAVLQSLVRGRQVAAAKKEAERVRPQVIAANPPPAQAGLAILDSTPPLNGEEFVPGFGFGGTALFKSLQANPGSWSPVAATAEGAVITRVIEKLPADPAMKNVKVMTARAENDSYIISNLYQQWMTDLPKSVKVENTLDQVYRE
jgi:peptidyl-prolyl cis-trans isomerase D